MAKRYKMKEGNLISMDSSLKKIKTVFEDQMMLLTRGIASNVRTKVMEINFATLRSMVRRLSIINMIINCREMQCAPFFEPAREIGDPGYVICKKGKLDKKFRGKDKKADKLVEMIEQTGFGYDPMREDDFMDFGKMFLRELLTIDQVAVELQRNRKGEIAAFWLIDGATIMRCTEEGYENNKKYAYVQEIDGQITAAYTRDEIIFDYMYKRADIRHRGYGYSLLEQAVDLITTLILGISYNRDVFTKDTIPQGFLAIQGEADDETIQALERYWYMAMTGVGAKFKIPILPSGKEGTSVDFKKLGQTTRDMDYYRLMMFFLSLFAGVFGMDLAELGIKTDMTQQTLGENIEGRVLYSKDRGLRSILSFMKMFMNKIIRKIDGDYEFIFLGIDPEDEGKKYDIHKRAIESTRTVNEMRAEDGQPALEGEEYDHVANQNLTQLRQSLNQGQEEEYAEGEEEYEEGEEENNQDIGEKEEEIENEKKETQKSLENHLGELIKAGYDTEVKI